MARRAITAFARETILTAIATALDLTVIAAMLALLTGTNAVDLHRARPHGHEHDARGVHALVTIAPITAVVSRGPLHPRAHYDRLAGRADGLTGCGAESTGLLHRRVQRQVSAVSE